MLHSDWDKTEHIVRIIKEREKQHDRTHHIVSSHGLQTVEAFKVQEEMDRYNTLVSMIPDTY